MSGSTQATGVSAALWSGGGVLSTLSRVTEEPRVGGRLLRLLLDVPQLHRKLGRQKVLSQFPLGSLSNPFKGWGPSMSLP